ncbi:MAG: hypothetical protein ACJ79H_12045 [Myxococcales bacterium]
MAVAVAGAVLAGCTKSGPQGRRVASGLARDVMVAPGGRMAAFLQGASHPDDRGVPDDLLVGDLVLASTSGDPAADRVGGGVPTLPAARAFSPGGEWLAFLARWRFRAGEGELWLAASGGAPRKVADGVSAMAWAPSGSLLAFVAGGRLTMLDASKEPAAPSVALDGMQTFAWAPGGDRLAGRGPGGAGGRVDLIDVRTGRVREVAKGSSDFSFAADGSLFVLGPPGAKGGDRPLTAVEGFEGRPREIGRATSFAVSERYVALLSTDRQPGEAFGALSRLPRSGGAAEPLGDRVSEFRFAQGGDLVFLARYDGRARAGALTAAPPGSSPRELAQRVQSFTVQGGRLLYLVQAPQKGDFKIELWTAPLDGSVPPRRVDDGVYGYQLTPDGRRLFWKARCAGGARSCSLFRAPADGSAPPQLLAANVAGFDLSDDAARVLVQQPHRGAARAVDLAVLDAAGSPPADGAVKTVATEVDPSSRFADASGRRLVYAAMGGAGQAGVYLLDVP